MRDQFTASQKFKTKLAAVTAIFLLSTLSGPADARRDRDGYRWITAESQFDFRTISAPVRSGPVGPQVRLPGGTWLNCEYSCEYTLRANTLDFFLCGEGGDDDCSPGILDDFVARRLDY